MTKNGRHRTPRPQVPELVAVDGERHCYWIGCLPHDKDGNACPASGGVHLAGLHFASVTQRVKAGAKETLRTNQAGGLVQLDIEQIALLHARMPFCFLRPQGRTARGEQGYVVVNRIGDKEAMDAQARARAGRHNVQRMHVQSGDIAAVDFLFALYRPDGRRDPIVNASLLHAWSQEPWREMDEGEEGVMPPSLADGLELPDGVELEDLQKALDTRKARTSYLLPEPVFIPAE